MSNRGNTPTGIWELVQNASRMKSCGMQLGNDIESRQKNRRLVFKNTRKKRGR